MGLLSNIFNMVMATKQYKLAEKANTANIEAQKRANDTNIMLTRETNAKQMELAEKEYQRSLPTNQVANYMNAGMSRAGALGALTGAGTYSAPSLNTAQVSPEKSDVSGQSQAIEQMMGVVANAMQMKQEKEIAREQMENAKEIARIQAESAQNVAEINSESSAYIADKDYEGRDLTSSRQLFASLQQIGLGYSELAERRRQYDDMSELNKELLQKQIKHLEAQTDLDKERKKEISDKLFEWNSSEQKDARKAMALLQALTDNASAEKIRFEAELYRKQHYNPDGSIDQGHLLNREYSARGEAFWNTAYNVLGGPVLEKLLSVVAVSRF